MAAKIKVIVKRAGEPVGHVTWISNTLANFQRTVEGHIEVVRIAPNAAIICNEDGKLKNLPVNFLFGKVVPDVIVGDVIVCGLDEPEFCDVPFGLDVWKALLQDWGN